MKFAKLYAVTLSKTKLFFLSFLTVWVVCGLAACSTTAPKPGDGGPVFYPPLPNPPRIQYLTSFSSSKDSTKPPTSFTDFVLGKEVEEGTKYIRKPYGVSLFEGKLYAVDTRGGGYGVFDLANEQFKMVVGSGAGAMPKPINIYIAPTGKKYISDTDRDQILEYDREDRFIRAYGAKDQFKPSDALVEGNKLYVADVKDHEIEVLDLYSGSTVAKIGKPGSKEGELFQPTNLARGSDGLLYVSETGNFRVQKFTFSGEPMGSIGSVGTSMGKFARPKGIATDRNGNLFVVDAAFENVQVFDPNGQLLMFFGGPGAHPANINLPTDIFIDDQNVQYFQKYADRDFKLKYIILVSSQYGSSKVNAYGFGTMRNMEY